jgi:hypothetical protein
VFFASLLLSSIGLDERLTFTRSTPRSEPVPDELHVGTDR